MLIRLKHLSSKPVETPRLRNSDGNPLGSPPSLRALQYHSINPTLLPPVCLVYLFILRSNVAKNLRHQRKKPCNKSNVFFLFVFPFVMIISFLGGLGGNDLHHSIYIHYITLQLSIQPCSLAAKVTMSMIVNAEGLLFNQKRFSKHVSGKYYINHERTERQRNHGPCPQKTDGLRSARHLYNVYKHETQTVP